MTILISVVLATAAAALAVWLVRKKQSRLVPIPVPARIEKRRR